MSTGIDRPAMLHRRPRRPEAGFSITETLVGLAASTVLAAGIGSLMVSSVKSQGRAETYARLQNSWNLAANLLETEASIAERLGSSTTAATGCTNLPAASVQLVLVGPGNGWRSYYGVRPVTWLEAKQWYGPNVLVRCGQPLGANTTTAVPEINTAGAVTEGVVVDGVPLLTSFNLQIPNTSAGSGEIARTGSVTLTVGAPGGGGTYANTFALRVLYNPVFGYNNDIINGLLTCTSPCQSSEITLPSGKKLIQYRPTASATINGNSSKEEVVYINANFSVVSLSSGCSRTSCVITSGTMVVTTTNITTLVFNDGSIGL